MGPKVPLPGSARDTLMIPPEDELPTVSYPSQAALGCSFDVQMVEELFSEIASDQGRFGYSVVSGASAGIKRDPSGGGNTGYFSEDPLLAGKLAAAAVKGITAAGYKACVEDIGSAGRSDMKYITDAAVDLRALHEIYLESARIAVAAGPAAISLTESRVRGVFASENTNLIQGTIRGDWGFDGAVLSAPGSVSDRVEALNAGVDVETTGCAENAAEIIEALEAGEVDRERLTEAAQRAVLLADREPSGEKEFNDVRAVSAARKAAAACAVLMKNSGGMLPISGDEFALIGVHAVNLPAVSAEDAVGAISPQSVLSELQELGAKFRFAEGYTYSGDTNSKLIAEAKEAAAESGRAVIVLGVPRTEGRDRRDISLPNGMLKLIDAVAAVCFQTAVVLVTCGPVEMPFADRVNAILTLYYSGTCTGGAAADIITGKVNPSGKLAETWPKKLSDCPADEWFYKGKRYTEHREGLYVGYRYYLPARVPTLFDFGHGLSYTRFAYSDMSIAPGSDSGWIATVKVTNAGVRSGSEVVQFYSVKNGTDVLSLKGFAKIHLLPGETRSVSVRFFPEDFKRFDEVRGVFRTEGGVYTIFSASSSTDLRESAELMVTDDGNGEFPGYFSAAEAGKISDDRFRELLGYRPDTAASAVISAESTPNDFTRTSIGAGLIEEIAATVIGHDPTAEETAEFLRIAGDMPLRTISDLMPDVFPRNRAESIVRLANKDFLGAAASLIFGRRRKRV